MTATRPGLRSSRALTLVEVLMATVVVGAGLALVALALSSSIRAEAHADDLVRVSRLVDLQLGRLEGGVLPIQNASGDFTTDGQPDVTWTITVETTQTANLQQVTVEADWDEQGVKHDMEVARLFYQDPDATTTSSTGTGR